MIADSAQTRNRAIVTRPFPSLGGRGLGTRLFTHSSGDLSSHTLAITPWAGSWQSCSYLSSSSSDRRKDLAVLWRACRLCVCFVNRRCACSLAHWRDVALFSTPVTLRLFELAAVGFVVPSTAMARTYVTFPAALMLPPR